MSAEIVPFPPAAAPVARPARFIPPAHGGRRYALRDMARKLAFENLDQRTLIAKLRLLARVDGMPLPLNPRTWGTQVFRDHRAICSQSQWDAGQVDYWLERPGPSAPATSAIPPIPPHARQDMRERALLIAQGNN